MSKWFRCDHPGCSNGAKTLKEQVVFGRFNSDTHYCRAHYPAPLCRFCKEAMSYERAIPGLTVLQGNATRCLRCHGVPDTLTENQLEWVEAHIPKDLWRYFDDRYARAKDD